MRLVFISDTHNMHEGLDLPDGDILLHCGDFSGKGTMPEVAAFMDWFGKQKHLHKICIAGNHDFLAERDPGVFRALVPENIQYLEDSGLEIEGIRIWGSPVQPWFYNWAFNRERGEDIQKHWDLIPEGTDILITHGPPFGILDEVVPSREKVGCKNLLETVKAKKLKLVAFGHIHEGYGRVEKGNTVYINASVLDEKYRHRNKPVVFDWK